MARRWIGLQVGQTLVAVGALLACAHSGDISPSGKGSTTSASGGTTTSVGGTTAVASGGTEETSDGGTTGEGGTATGGSKAGGAGGGSATGVAGRSAAGGTKASSGGSAVAGSISVVAGTAGRSGNGGTVAVAGSTGKGGATSGGVAGATGAGEFKCSAANSVAVKTDTDFDAALDECYTWTKPANGTFQIGNWSGKTMTVQLKDSKKVFADVDVKSSVWTPISGVATGDVYFYVSQMSSGPTARIKVNSF